MTGGGPGTLRPPDTGPGALQERGTAGRWELLRALGAITLEPGGAGRPAAALGLRPWTAAEHTRGFVLALPPHASIYLGPEGKLGGEGADRVAGVWRAIGLTPPSNGDHLAAILALYAELGEASQDARTAQARQRLGHLREAVLWEHLHSWVPSYLEAIHPDPAFTAWANLLDRALRREMALSQPPADLPLALRSAPGSPTATDGYGNLLDALITPVRTGFILTYDDLAAAARQAGLGLRRGERRFALTALMGQDPAATLAWLARHARCWSGLHHHRAAACASTTDQWWARRAAATADALGQLAQEARHAASGQ